MLLPSLLYNGGRLVSYTVIGILVGALGSVITLTGRFQGIVQIVAGGFMVIMGINMLGLFPALRRLSPRIPKPFEGKLKGRGPFVIGFLNGFMPCGPLQAMQLYALSTGSPIRGGISMFLFCAGTIPLMFALGAVSSALTGVKGRAFSRRVMQAGAIVVVALGLVMFSNGWSISRLNSNTASSRLAPSQSAKPASNSTPPMPEIKNGEQIVNSILQPNRYPAITVQQGIPVRWTINAPAGNINGCNNSIIIREYGIQYAFMPGDNVINFTPTKPGRFLYTCWMGMIKSTITVVPKVEAN
jgi:sulfite exporter TauE/SafE